MNGNSLHYFAPDQQQLVDKLVASRLARQAAVHARAVAALVAENQQLRDELQQLRSAAGAGTPEPSATDPSTTYPTDHEDDPC